MRHGQHFGRKHKLVHDCIYCRHVHRYPITKFGILYMDGDQWVPEGWIFDTSDHSHYGWLISDLLAICQEQIQIRGIITIDPEHRNNV